MKKRHCDGNYRSIRTTQERRAYYAHKEYVRGKRTARNIPSTWDDTRNRSFGMRKSWKSKRKNQYHVGGRGKKHVFYLDSNIREWYITDYLKRHNIPYKLEEHKEGTTRWNANYGKWYHYTATVGYLLTLWTDKEIQFPNEAFKE